jgi:hypothetical protein
MPDQGLDPALADLAMSNGLRSGQTPTGSSTGDAAPDAVVEAKFEMSQPDEQIGSFSELQGITTNIDVVEHDNPVSPVQPLVAPLPDDNAPTDDAGGWEHTYEFRTGKVAQTDHDFETPVSDGGTSAAGPGFFDGRLLTARDLASDSPSAGGQAGLQSDGDLVQAVSDEDAPKAPSTKDSQPPAGAEEPETIPGKVEYPNLKFYVPEADAEPPTHSQGFGFVTFGDAAEGSANVPLIGTAVGEAIGNPAGDSSEDEAELEDDGAPTLVNLSGESPAMTLIHKAGDFDAVLSHDDSDADDDDADDDP